MAAPFASHGAAGLLQDSAQADIAVQEAWIGICRGWMTLRDPAKFPAWAFQILHHKCRDIIKHNQRDRVTFSEYTEGLSPRAAVFGEKRIMLDEAFAQLSTEQRAAAILYFAEGLTLFEIATATSAPLGTVKSRIFHARQHLKTALSGEQYD